MIGTPHFTFLHLPKTGGTFVNKALYRAYDAKSTWQNSLRSIFSRYHRFDTKYGPFVHYKDKHGGRSQIPALLAHSRLLSCIRLPYDRYVSAYEFKWWQRRDTRMRFRRLDDFDSRFPNFPDLSFREFLVLVHAAFMPTAWRDFENDSIPGINTWLFIRQFADKPHRFVNRPMPGSSDLHRISADVTFLRTHRLNSDLYESLLGFGLEERSIEFIPNENRVLPFGKGRDEQRTWELYYDAELKQLIREKDRALFELFPEFDDLCESNWRSKRHANP